MNLGGQISYSSQVKLGWPGEGNGCVSALSEAPSLPGTEDLRMRCRAVQTLHQKGPSVLALPSRPGDRPDQQGQCQQWLLHTSVEGRPKVSREPKVTMNPVSIQASSCCHHSLLPWLRALRPLTQTCVALPFPEEWFSLPSSTFLLHVPIFLVHTVANFLSNLPQESWNRNATRPTRRFSWDKDEIFPC